MNFHKSQTEGNFQFDFLFSRFRNPTALLTVPCSVGQEVFTILLQKCHHPARATSTNN